MEEVYYYINERQEVTAYVRLPESFGGLVLVLGTNNDIFLTFDGDVLTLREG